jgi:hypothetical protein
MLEVLNSGLQAMTPGASIGAQEAHVPRYIAAAAMSLCFAVILDASEARFQTPTVTANAQSTGKWRVLMERQFAEVTQDVWDKLPKWNAS